MSDRVLILGLDGATFTVLEPFMQSGLMPTLAKLCEGGVRADLRSTMPPLTPPAWTTLMTGKRPGHHGVFDFFQKEAPGSEYYRLSTSNDIKTPTIWSLASARSTSRAMSSGSPAKLRSFWTAAREPADRKSVV